MLLFKTVTFLVTKTVTLQKFKNCYHYLKNLY